MCLSALLQLENEKLVRIECQLEFCWGSKIKILKGTEFLKKNAESIDEKMQPSCWAAEKKQLTEP